VRGGIVDVFPMGAPAPYRIDLFGKKLSLFACLTQRANAPERNCRGAAAAGARSATPARGHPALPPGVPHTI